MINGKIITAGDVRGISKNIWDEIVENYTSSNITVENSYGTLVIHFSGGIDIIYNTDKIYIEFKDGKLNMWSI
jgi:hypothetical protein